MKTSIILLTFLLLFLSENIAAQQGNGSLWRIVVPYENADKDSLWNVFRVAFDERIAQARAEDNFRPSVGGLNNFVFRSPIERKTVEYLAETFAQDTIPGVRNLAGEIMREVARRSNDSISRQQAIHFILDTSLSPELSHFFLRDFDDSMRQKIMELFKQEPTEQLSFLVETSVRSRMRRDHFAFNRQVNELLKQYGDTKSDKEIWQQIYKAELSAEMERVLRERLSFNTIILVAQLNMQEAIPYLKKMANDELHIHKHAAAYALAIMRVEDFEERIVPRFEIDTHRYDIRLASIINSQKVWYAYIHRIKSEKYSGDCPVAYRTIMALDDVLRIRMKPGLPPPVLLLRNIRAACLRMGDDLPWRVPIDPDIISAAVRWMRMGKYEGRFELRYEVVRAY